VKFWKDIEVLSSELEVVSRGDDFFPTPVKIISPRGSRTFWLKFPVLKPRSVSIVPYCHT